ncbi:acetolactate synthase large subunit [Nevskia ramosa]|uniref:acetolactate synthase large subunit n=1 Tax=Nevskia ramosa TaxID=64002 RepID=UPI003D0B120B
MNDAKAVDSATDGKTIKAAELFVRCLEAEGVEIIFGLPGEENADLMIALLDSKIRFILVRHEQAAAFMADVYGRLTGRAGVCLATLGPGATNLVTGLADANLDRSPVVAIIGQGSTRRLHKESHQNMDAIAMMRPISKWAQSIIAADSIPEILRKAFKLAEAEKPGVCVIELPEDVAKHQIVGTPMPVYRTRRPTADARAVEQAVAILANAKNPVILAGNGALRDRAAVQLSALAHKTGLPVFNTFMGKGALTRSDPHNLFTIGLQAHDYGNQAMASADAVLVIGYDLVEYSPQFWNAKRDKQIIHVDFLPAEVDQDYAVSADVVGDIAGTLAQISALLDRDYSARLPLHDIGKWQPLREQIAADHGCERNDTGFPIKPQKVLWDVREFLKADDILLSDVGAHKLWIGRYYPAETPNSVMISNGFCSMGFALPGAIGAKFAAPEKRVLAICGDAGFLMNLQDLETAVRYQLNIVVMIWVDGSYGLIEWKQQNEFGKHFPLEFSNPDFELLAQSFGCWGRTLTTTDQLPGALEEAFRQPGPALIAVPVDYRENVKLTERMGQLVAKL